MTVLLLIGIVAGLVLLTVSADQFVLGAARVAVVLRLSTVVIGAVVIGFGTSAPEMVVSGLAAASGSLDIAVGNIIGSNIANLSLVLGTASMTAPIVVGSSTIRREAPLSLGAVLVFAVLVQGGLTRIEGGVLFVLLVGALGYILLASRDEADDELTGEVDEYLDDDGLHPGREWLRTGLGLLGTLIAAQLLVYCASTLARQVGLKEGFVGLTIVGVTYHFYPPAVASTAGIGDRTARWSVTALLGGLGLEVIGSLASASPLVGAGRWLSVLGAVLYAAVLWTIFLERAK